MAWQAMQFDFLNSSSLANAGPATNQALEAKPMAKVPCKALRININFISKIPDDAARYLPVEHEAMVVVVGVINPTHRPHCRKAVRLALH